MKDTDDQLILEELKAIIASVRQDERKKADKVVKALEKIVDTFRRSIVSWKEISSAQRALANFKNTKNWLVNHLNAKGKKDQFIIVKAARKWLLF